MNPSPFKIFTSLIVAPVFLLSRDAHANSSIATTHNEILDCSGTGLYHPCAPDLCTRQKFS